MLTAACPLHTMTQLRSARDPEYSIMSSPLQLNESETAMTQYVGLHVSQKISVCTVDERGRVAYERRPSLNLSGLTRLLRKRAPKIERIDFRPAPWRLDFCMDFEASAFPSFVSMRNKRMHCSQLG